MITVDGSTTERLRRLVAVLRKAGLKARIERRMVDWQATHAALVAPFAVLTIKHGSNTYALAKATGDLRDLADAMRETLVVLRALGHRIVPASSNVLGRLPRFVVVPIFRAFLSSRIAEIGGAWHCQQAPDEMAELARELRLMVERSGLPVPSLRKVLGLAEHGAL